ncbi:MAG: HAD hydrolase family protein [Bacteroidetes bacterium]|nr:HAD hydrolase family protein [Bacteroidota bacterium]
MNEIKLFLTDIDGVWTDGGMYYDNEGNELKKFNTSDSAGVLFLRMMDIPLGIISGEDTEIVRRRAKKLGINILHMGVRNKLSVVKKICEEMNISLREVAYLGDDIIDIPVFEEVGLSAAPANSPDYVRKHADWTLEKYGGEGVFREFVERYLSERGLLDEALQRYLSKIR